MNKLLALADRVEKLTGPSRQIDGEIYATLSGLDFPAGDNEKGRITRQVRMDCAKFYTGCMDAARSLVPEGWFTKLAMEDRHSHSWRWDLRGGFGYEVSARAAIPSLAITVSALRARAHGGGEG